MGVGVCVGVGLGVCDGLGVCVGLGEGVTLGVGEGVGATVGVGAGVGVGLGPTCFLSTPTRTSRIDTYLSSFCSWVSLGADVSASPTLSRGEGL